MIAVLFVVVFSGACGAAQTDLELYAMALRASCILSLTQRQDYIPSFSRDWGLRNLLNGTRYHTRDGSAKKIRHV